MSHVIKKRKNNRGQILLCRTIACSKQPVLLCVILICVIHLFLQNKCNKTLVDGLNIGGLKKLSNPHKVDLLMFGDKTTRLFLSSTVTCIRHAHCSGGRAEIFRRV